MRRPVLVVAALSAVLLVPVITVSAAPPQQPVVQAPARDTAQPRTGTSRIRGRVLAADTGAPVRRAIVRLSSQDMRQPRGTTTDADGRYDIGDLPSGTYYVMVSKTGFLIAQYGSARPGDIGKPVKLGDAEVAADIDLLLTRGGAIAGRILDEFGDPVAGAMVRVFRYQSVGGARRLVMAGGSNGSTNDLGQYRVYGLQPGSYYLSAQTTGGGSDVEAADRTGYAPTFYPGTASVSEAQPIQIAAGQDAGGIDLMLAVTRTARISGMLIDQQGRPIASQVGVSAMLLVPGLTGGGGGGGYYGGPVRPDGTFTINGLPPGDYTLSANYSPGPGRDQMQYGRARISVAGSDITGITIQTTTGATLSGQVIFDGASVPPKPKMMISTTFSSLGPDMTGPSPPPAPVRDDGTFTQTGVFGERLIRISGIPSGWTLKAVYLSGRDITDAPMTFEGTEKISGLQIVLTDRLTHLTGTVTDDLGQPADMAYILVFADDPAKWSGEVMSRFIRRGVARPGTPMKIDGTPPGDYIVVALKFTQNLDTTDPELLERLRKVGTRVTLREGETKDVALKLIDPGAR